MVEIPGGKKFGNDAAFWKRIGGCEEQIINACTYCDFQNRLGKESRDYNVGQCKISTIHNEGN
jgi:hypothetical protein